MSSTLVVEEFRTIDDAELEELAQLASDEEAVSRERLTTELGLKLQKVRSVQEARKFYGDPLTDEELEIWTAFLPTGYSKDQGSWKSYNFDHIPNYVLAEIQTADSLTIFQDLQIWTPERQDRFDPMVVGVVIEANEKHFFKVIRWGESLASFESIKQTVEARSRWVRRWIGLQVALTLMIAAAIIVQAVHHMLRVSNDASGLIVFGFFALVLTALCAIAGGMIISDWATKWGLKRYTVEQTWTTENTPISQVSA